MTKDSPDTVFLDTGKGSGGVYTRTDAIQKILKDNPEYRRMKPMQKIAKLVGFDWGLDNAPPKK